MKKAFGIVLVLVLIWISCAAIAERSGDFEYYLADDGTAEISGYHGRSSDLVIPSEIDGHKVTAIGNKAFIFDTFVKNLVIPDSVTVIWYMAFSFADLEKVTIGEGVREIDIGAFAKCTDLRSVTIPDNVEIIGAGAFRECDALSSVTIGDGTIEIGPAAFEDCKRLENLLIGKNVKTIKDNAFNGCVRLKNVTLNANLAEIGDEAFENNGRLTLTVPADSYSETWAKNNGFEPVILEIN